MSNTGAKTKAVVRRFINPRQATLGVLGILLGALVGGVVASVSRSPDSIIRAWESATYDYRLRTYADPTRVSPDLVVLAIDNDTEKFFKANDPKSFPPDRGRMARVLEVLTKLGARGVVLDYMFDGAITVYSGEYVDPFVPPAFGSTDLHLMSREFGTNAALNGHVAAGISTTEVRRDQTEIAVNATTGWSPALAPYLDARLLRIRASAPPPEYVAQTPERILKLLIPEGNVLAGVRAFGYVDLKDLDSDQIVRGFSPVVTIDSRLVPALSIAGFAAVSAPKGSPVAFEGEHPPPPDRMAPPPEVSYDANGVSVGGVRIPIGPDGRAWVRWRGNWGASPLLEHVLSIAPYLVESNQDAVILAEDDAPLPADVPIRKSDIAGKIVVIGYTARGEYTDKVSTPFGFQPGVFWHVSILDTLLTKDFLRSVPLALDATLIVVMSALVGGLIFGLPKFKWLVSRGMYAVAAYQSVLAIIPMASYFAIVCFVAFPRSWVVNLVPAELGMSVTGLLVLFASISVERAGLESEKLGKEQALALAKKALSPELVEQYQATYAGAPPLGGERVELTVYFSDIAGFTTISEKLPPEELIGILNEYLSRVTELMVDKHRAYLDKYIGDAVMAFWGAPIPAPDGPIRACLAAIDTMAAMSAYSAELVARGLTPLKTRIGINTGPAIAGVVGHAKSKINYTALGDTVNLASRLEGANKAYGTTCMLGPGTYEAAKDVVLARELDLVKVKGKNIPVRVYELMGKATDPLPREREIKARYESALVLFRERRFADARAAFLALAQEFGDPPAKTLARSCDEMLATPPPPDWDGSNELHEK